MKNDVLVLIPARYQSTRFPGKPLVPIAGVAMILRVAQNLSRSGYQFAIVTDDQRVESVLLENNQPVVRVDDDVPSGTERIAIAYERYFSHKNFSLVVNVQGDEPLIGSEALDNLVNFHQKNDFDIATLVRKNADLVMFNQPDVVKVVLSKNNQCLYFSRSPIPYSRDNNLKEWNQHIGIYSYKAESLKKFISYPVSELEETEKLEQLRAIDNGLTIGANFFQGILIGVDRPDDIKKVERYIDGT